MKSFWKLPRLLRWMLSVGFIFLLLMTLMRIGFFLFFNTQGRSISHPGVFLLGLRYDLRFIGILLLSMLVLGSVKPFHPFESEAGKRFWFGMLTLVTLFIIFFYIVDFAHYNYLNQRLNASVLNYFADARISIKMVWQSYPVIWLLIGLFILAAMMVLFFRRTHRSIRNNFIPSSKKVRRSVFVVTFLILGLLIFGRFGQYPLRWSDAFGLRNDYEANLALNPFETFFNTLKFRHSTYDENKVKQFYPEIAKYLGIEIHDTPSLNFERTVTIRDTTSIKPNVVLVICESFSAYKSSMWGNPLNTTPFFDSLVRNGFFFDHCFSPAYGTARGVWAIITGIPDVSTPTTASRNPAYVDQHTIINYFKGYEKFYFIGGSSSWANIRGLLTNNIYGLNLYEQDNFKAPKIDVWGISDKNLFLESNAVLAKQTKPFFAIIQTADNHRPYTIPKEDLMEFKKTFVPMDSLKKYGFESLSEMNAFRYTDFGFRKFMEAAVKEKYFENTIFVFVGDHGIAGDAGEMFPKAWTAQKLTTEHIPLLFYGPNFINKNRVNKISSQVDVLPSIAGLCKISYTNKTIGRDLFDSSAFKEFAFIFDPEFGQIGVISENYFYRRQASTGREELVSIINNDATDTNPGVTDITKKLRMLSEGIYETSRYMLANNKKKN